MPVFDRDLCLLHEKFDLIDFGLGSLVLYHLVQGRVVSADDFHLGGLTAGLIVNDAVSRHVDAHVSGGFVGIAAVNALKNGIQHRKDFNVPIIVYRGLAVSLQMKGIDHVHIIQVRRGRLIGQIDGVLERDVPDREGLELGVARLDAPQVVMVELGQAGGHFPAARTGSRDDYERARCLYIVVFPITVFADDQGDIGGIALYGIMEIHLYIFLFQFGFELFCAALSGIMSDDYNSYVQSSVEELVPQPQNVHVVCNAEIPSHLVLLDVGGADNYNDLCIIGKLHQHLQLRVGCKAGKHSGGMVIIEKLSSEFQIELVPELNDALFNMLRLHFQILAVVKTDFHCVPRFYKKTDMMDFMCFSSPAEPASSIISPTTLRFHILPQIAPHWNGKIHKIYGAKEHART